MSSFFTLPASQKKRKRNENGVPSTSKRTKNSIVSNTARSRQQSRRKSPRDDSISGSDSEEGDDLDSAIEDEDDQSGSEVGETGAERRLRLAEQYLENVKNDVEEIGFNAEDVDRDLIAERLKDDVAETKGKLYRHIAAEYDFASATRTAFRFETDCVTAIASCPPYVYTTSRDIFLTKWELPSVSTRTAKSKIRNNKVQKQPPPPRHRPLRLIATRGSRKKSADASYRHHFRPILCVAASSDGRFVATGGEDKRLIIWSAEDLKPLRVFTQHRDSVTSLAFRRGTNQLYSASSDRTIKTWSLDELAYVETLFGHQDQVVDVAALSEERCLSAGARDRTVRLWKVVEETQLVFRGGGSGGNGGGERKARRLHSNGNEPCAEGSIDRVELVDEETFITGSDNGALSLWDIHKKKPVFVLAKAHGLDPPPKREDAFAEEDLEGRVVPTRPIARWITALKVVPYSDLIISGSWDGSIRVWKITQDRKKIEALGIVGKARVEGGSEVIVNGADDGHLGNQAGNNASQSTVSGLVNDLDVFERGAEHGVGDSLCIVAAIGKHHRLGRWKMVDGKNGAVVFEVSRISL